MGTRHPGAERTPGDSGTRLCAETHRPGPQWAPVSCTHKCEEGAACAPREAGSLATGGGGGGGGVGPARAASSALLPGRRAGAPRDLTVCTSGLLVTFWAGGLRALYPTYLRGWRCLWPLPEGPGGHSPARRGRGSQWGSALRVTGPLSWMLTPLEDPACRGHSSLAVLRTVPSPGREHTALPATPFSETTSRGGLQGWGLPAGSRDRGF